MADFRVAVSLYRML